MVKRELDLRVSRGHYVIIRGSPFLSSMTAIPKGDSLPNRNVISRDPRDPAIEALQKLPQERKRELQNMDRQLQKIQQNSKVNHETRSINHIISVAFKEKPKVNFQEEVEVTHYGKNDPLSEPGKAPWERDYSNTTCLRNSLHQESLRTTQDVLRHPLTRKFSYSYPGLPILVQGAERPY